MRETVLATGGRQAKMGRMRGQFKGCDRKGAEGVDSGQLVPVVRC